MEKGSRFFIILCIAALAVAAFVPRQAFALSSLSVVDQDGNPVAAYKWLLEEDTTHETQPGVFDVNSIGVSIHRSYAPVVATGTQSQLNQLYSAVDAGTRYYVSVLPDISSATPNYTMSGTPIAAGQASATVTVVANPIPTAQILVLAFHDDHPINSAPDFPAEEPLAGFQVLLFDQAGQQMTDGFGNNLGTTYVDGDNDGIPDLDADGAPIVLVPGNGVFTGPDGQVLIKNLAPGKYGVRITPPTPLPGDPPGTEWVQTSTIEGTPGIDAWVHAGNPPFFQEFGLLFWHAFIGFVHPMEFPPDPVLLPGQSTGTIHGFADMMYQSVPPFLDNAIGGPISGAWIGLNNLSGNDEQVYSQPADPETGEFTINNVPPGIYQLVIWDSNLDVIIQFFTATVPDTGGLVELGMLPNFMWFGNFEGSVFYDSNENGFRDPGEGGLSGQAINLRFRDGSIYQSTVTVPPNGEFALNEIFPFFRWLVAEVDFGRFKATGATFWVDAGAMAGQLPGVRNWQDQFPTDYIDDITTPQLGTEFRTETGVVLTEGIQIFADQLNMADYGKKEYVVGPDDILGTPDDIPGENGGIAGIVYYSTTRAEDDPRFAAGEPWEPGIPGVTVELYQVTGRNPDGTPIIDPTPVAVAVTDSWDASMPTGCAGDDPLYVDCAEGLISWNQMRPAVFDGGYAFPGWDGVEGIMPGEYVVKAYPPDGYKIVSYGDRNVDFGDSLQGVPAELFFQPECVGTAVVIPEFLSLDGETENPMFNPADPTATGPECDMKLVLVEEGDNPVCDFFMFTDVPKAARCVGLVTDDVGGEPNPNNPRFGDKKGVAWIPVSFQDFAGNEINRVYTDEFGGYNALLPSTYTVNVPNPTGVSPHMIQVVLNDPGPDPNNKDQYYNPSYSTTSLTFDFWPGKTTILDTPLLRTDPFGSVLNVDCEPPANAPVIGSVSSTVGGPYVEVTPDTITITAAGDVEIRNPAFDPNAFGPERQVGPPPTIIRHYDFGATEGTVTVNGVALPIVTWTPDVITATVPTGTETGQLMVTRGDSGLTTKIGVTLHVRTRAYRPRVYRVPGDFATIQEAINGTPRRNALILVAPGQYNENLIMWHQVKLQGYGAGSTIINGSAFTTAARAAWEEELNFRIKKRQIRLIDGQNNLLHLDPGAVITVGGKNGAGRFREKLNAQIDGFLLTGANRGGAVLVNSYAYFLEISNNRIYDNEGNLGGGIRLGTPSLVNASATGFNSSFNENVSIHNNLLTTNGAVDGGGGIAVFNGSNSYSIRENCLCGNFSLLYGGGIAHFGLSQNGWITDNEILFNQAFDEGGGIMLAGELVPAGAPVGTLSPGTGSVTIDGNRIIGNQSGDDGGGLMGLIVNGQDVAANPANPSLWHRVNITNNFFVNNISADAGGGMVLDDAANVNVIHNTIAWNDSTSTGVDAFGVVFPIPQLGGVPAPGQSTPLPAGIFTKAHSAGLMAAFDPSVAQLYSSPVLYNNVIYNNRSWFYDPEANPQTLPTGRLVPREPPIWDLGVLGTSGTEMLSPEYCILSDADGYGATNFAADPLFVSEVGNNIAAFQAGAVGNLITLEFTAADLATYDPHLTASSTAIDTGTETIGPIGGWMSLLDMDIDDDARGALPDRGADEFQGAAGPDLTGPQTLYAAFSPSPTDGAADVTLTATADETHTGGANIMAAEWWFDVDQGLGANNAMAAADGTFDSPTESLTALITHGLADGSYVFYVRSQDANGNWGLPVAAGLTVGAAVPDVTGPRVTGLSATPNPTGGAPIVTLTGVASEVFTGGGAIAAAEWWIGAVDPGMGLGTPMAASDGAFDTPVEGITGSIDVSGLAEGSYTVNVRAQDSAANWGMVSSTVVDVLIPDTVTITRIVYNAGTQRLLVEATSDEQPNVTLTADGLGELTYRTAARKYKGVFRPVANPGSVTVRSNKGGSDTAPVPFP